VIEIRTFDGDLAEAARFTTGVWTAAYRGHHPVPLWDDRYYDWQLFGQRHDRSLAVAAYDGARLVGTFFAEPFPISIAGRDHEASMSSWLTVDPETRGQGVARRMADEMRRRHRERNLACSIGFAIRGTTGPGFWKAMPDTIIFGKIGFWARLLDHRAVAGWLTGAQRATARIFGPLVTPLRAEETSAVRAYRDDDLETCLALVSEAAADADVGYRWTRDRLRWQLSYPGMPKTLVIERNGKVSGFINYYSMDFLLRTTLRVAQVDLLIAHALTGSEQTQLISAALHDLANEGTKLVLVPRMSGCPTAPLLRNRFVPLPADMSVTCVVPDESIPRQKFSRYHLHVR
jgi:GNAT superfamily N-acetyltransferase